MIFLKNVTGTQSEVPPLEINVDTVYIRTNIVQEIDENGNFYWKYDEEQLSLIEYFKKILPENESAIIELTNLLYSYQNSINNALAELSIIIGEKNNV